MFKKSAVIFSSYSGLPGIHSPTSASTTSSCQSSYGRPLGWLQRNQCRAYAIVANGYSSHHHGNIPWPELTSADAIPTPYQIFNQKKGSPYSKQKFYDLVKMYHPDRHNIKGMSNDLSHATKLERYRLVIAANEVLSDPVKRRAYDSYGAGWNGCSGVKYPYGPPESADGWGTYSWGGGSRGPSQNATWEDWERWYQRDEKSKQQPTYVSNSTFVCLIIIFAALGGIGQATRAEKQSTSVLEKREALHREIGKELGRRRKESATSGDPRERVHNFLRLRNPYEYHLDLQGEQYQRLPSAPETFSSADTKTRPKNVYIPKKSDTDLNDIMS